MPEPLLELRGVRAGYGRIEVLHGRVTSVGQPADLEEELSAAYLGAST